MRYEEQLEHAALTLAAMSPALASAVSATCGVGLQEQARFRDTAREVADRFDLCVLVDQEGGLSTASFYRRDETPV